MGMNWTTCLPLIGPQTYGRIPLRGRRGRIFEPAEHMAESESHSPFWKDPALLGLVVFFTFNAIEYAAEVLARWYAWLNPWAGVAFLAMIGSGLFFGIYLPTRGRNAWGFAFFALVFAAIGGFAILR